MLLNDLKIAASKIFLRQFPLYQLVSLPPVRGFTLNHNILSRYCTFFVSEAKYSFEEKFASWIFAIRILSILCSTTGRLHPRQCVLSILASGASVFERVQCSVLLPGSCSTLILVFEYEREKERNSKRSIREKVLDKTVTTGLILLQAERRTKIKGLRCFIDHSNVFAFVYFHSIIEEIRFR